MKTLDVIAAVLLVIGGLNWGLVGLFNFDLVSFVFTAGGSTAPGAQVALARVIYVLVGIAAVYQAVSVKAIQHRWGMSGMKTA
jgi:uncharacterized membrane protein YuzA (DUF378 family)